MNLIHQTPIHDAALWNDYRPGTWEQDIVTLPLGGAVLFMLDAHNTRVSRPVWPFRTESISRKRDDTRHPKTLLTWAGGGVLVGTFGVLSLTKPNFALWPAVSGLVHTHLATELLTGFSKRFWLRRRPFYNRKLAETGYVAEDDSYSFFSGHASHSMAFATYLSWVLHENVENQWITWTSTAGLVATAAWVGSARAIDGQHHWSDVITGATVGGLVATFVAYKASQARIDRASEQSAGFTVDVGFSEFTATYRF
jgi:membrane-associated phospholipid phosphatase